MFMLIREVPVHLALSGLAGLFGVGFFFRRLQQHAERSGGEAALEQHANLQHFAAALAKGGEAGQVAEGALDQVLRALAASEGCLLLETPLPDGLRWTSARGLGARTLERLSEDPLCAYLAASGERWGNLMVFPDLLRGELKSAWQRDARFQQFREVLLAEGLRTLLVAPFQGRERSYGALLVGSRRARLFSPGELKLLLALAQPISLALENRFLSQTARRHREDLHTLNRIVEAVSASFEPRSQLATLRHELAGILGPAELSLTLQDAGEGACHTIFASDGEAEGAAPPRPPDENLVNYVLQSGAPLLVSSDFQRPSGQASQEQSEYVLCSGGPLAGSPELESVLRGLAVSPDLPHVRTWCGIPIRFSDSSLAVLALADYKRERAWDDQQLEFLQILARGVAVSLENARLFQRKQRRARHLALLNELGRKAAAVLHPRELLANICAPIRSAFGYDLVWIETLDGEGKELVVEAQEGYGSEFLGRRTPLEGTFAGAAARTQRAVLSNDLRLDGRSASLDPRAHSALSLPMVYGRETLAVLSLASFQEDAFPPQDVLTLETLADQLAVALRNARAYQTAKQEAITDGLTHLKTHRFFMEALEGEWRRAPRASRHFSLIMMDLDGFKRVNDRYGHVEGDRVLVAVARLLEARSRQSNVLSRYGGDEFAILMPEGALEQAETLAERLRASLAADPFLASHGLTASFGLATFPVHGATPEEILRIADAGMYLAKHEKGNRVRTASNPASPNHEWEQRLLEAYLGVAVKRMFATGPEAFNQYFKRFQEATQNAQGEGLSLLDTVTALAFAIDAKDHYTQGHSQSVSRLAAQIGRQLGLPDSELEEIRLAGILHDIGKIGIPESVLNKPTRLTDEEHQIMKSHAALGDKILEPLKVRAIQRIRRMVRHHHECFDGRGYPDGLSGDTIPLGARILAIADAFDTMVTRRSYKLGFSVPEAVAELRRCRGGHFDSQLVDAFLLSLEVDHLVLRGGSEQAVN
jgi:diguanylate cyclase (GGDEF)-like protein/putative nucleotidyltransferase with HDIG domain